MVKTFTAGIVLGAAGVIAALFLLPAVDQYREVSIITVTPNGGNAENFHVNIPMDRIMVGDRNAAHALPPDLDWPDYPVLDGVRAELFKLRNSRNAVVGVASRLEASKKQDSDLLDSDLIEWVLHLPARGSMYVKLDSEPVENGRSGEIRAGTREFENIVGAMSERWISDESVTDDALAGRIQLDTIFMSRISPDVEGGVE